MAQSVAEFATNLSKEVFSPRGKLYREFVGRVTEYVFAQIHASYKIKSKGETDNYGQYWKPNRRSREGKLIMVVTGRLLRSFTPGKANRNGYRRYNQDQKFEVNGTTVTIGSQVTYLKYQKREVIVPFALDLIVAEGVSFALKKMSLRIQREL